MKVRVQIGNDTHEADFVGFMYDDRGDMSVVVRLTGYGMFLRAFHPSKIEMPEPGNENQSAQQRLEALRISLASYATGDDPATDTLECALLMLERISDDHA